MSDTNTSPGAIARFWDALLAEFDKYGGLHPTELQNWSKDSANEAPVQLKASTVRDWQKTRRTAPQRDQTETLLMYLEHLRSQAERAEGGEIKRPAEHVREHWWRLWRPAFEERKSRRSQREPQIGKSPHLPAETPPALTPKLEQGPRTSHPGLNQPDTGPREGRRRGRWIAVGAVLAVLAGGGMAYCGNREAGQDTRSQADGPHENTPGPAGPLPAPQGAARQPEGTHSQRTDTALPQPGEPMFLCAFVRNESAGVYEAPDVGSTVVKWKPQDDGVRILERKAPPGWVMVNTPQNPPGYHWMREQALTNPERKTSCPMTR